MVEQGKKPFIMEIKKKNNWVFDQKKRGVPENKKQQNKV